MNHLSMSVEMVLEDPGLGEHLSADVAEESGAVAAVVGRAHQQVLVQGNGVTKDLECQLLFFRSECKTEKNNVRNN
jgi:hypothetical protein